MAIPRERRAEAALLSLLHRASSLFSLGIVQLTERKSRPGHSGGAASQLPRDTLQSQNRKRLLRLEPRNRAGHPARSANHVASETAHHILEQAPARDTRQ